MAKRGSMRVGTSGYQYDHWREVFYPPDLPKTHWFEHYAEHFDTVEINNTFYHLPEASTFDEWRDRAPEGFLYAVKFSRYGTHMKKLKDPEQTVEAFVENAEHLRSRLGPILVQLPPNWHVDADRLDAFLKVTPRRHRWAVELRDPSWLCEEVYAVLERHGAALCIHDIIEDHPWRTTADWVYLRFHGLSGGRKYSGEYSPQALTGASRRIEHLLEDGMDVYAYFNNDAHGYAVKNAQQLRRYQARRSGD